MITLAFVGGFLGAGKTTLLLAAARALAARGQRAGLVANDQAGGLVDTARLAQAGLAVDEVTGSCFCCNFEGLLQSFDRLIASGRPTTILAEPVGSCTDIAATVLRPLRERHGGRFRVAPFTVLADPVRLRRFLGPGATAFPEAVRHIYRTQLDEADLLAVAKADLLAVAEREELRALAGAARPGIPVHLLSGLTGEGLDPWLAAVLGAAPAGGEQRVEVDYAVYAAGEAALGWLNARAELEGPADWAAVGQRLLDSLGRRCAADGLEVAHAKFWLEAGPGRLRGQLTGGRETPTLAVDAAGLAGSRAAVTLNLRIAGVPAAVEALARAAVAEAAAGLAVRIAALDCFAPLPPKPTHRLA